MLAAFLMRKPVLSRGSAIFTTPGTYDFIVPAGVTLLCGVGIGAGGGGWQNTIGGTSTWGSSGGGGGLGWKNAIPVTPGEHLIVVVGALGITAVGNAIGTNGGDSYLARGSTKLFAGYGGLCGGATGSNTSYGKGGGYLGDGGGNGGAGVNFDYAAAGGGGAGGYTGNGGQGTDISQGAAGLGGGASGGRGGTNYTDNGSAGRGGGTGLFGLGNSAAAQTTRWGNGLPGSQIAGGGEFGGGSSSSRVITPNTPGLDGGLRLIWGKNRAYPSTDCGAD
ncbi:hypothetical protein [Burkholderia phage FLC6]|nr:hypothetical protein [Burkholderia phage FLC6]